jgi:hypothetical protein
MPSVHDSLLTGYTVDGKIRSIVFHTEPHRGGGDVPIDVVFAGVIAYHIEADCFENIVFDIEEVPASQIVGDGTAFAERHRLHGWPEGWNPDKETAEQFLSRPGISVFALNCSYGATAWVAARTIEERVIPVVSQA